jgi:hypothetical protein
VEEVSEDRYSQQPEDLSVKRQPDEVEEEEEEELFRPYCLKVFTFFVFFFPVICFSLI